MVQRCISRWEELHPQWELIKLDAQNVHEYVDPFPFSEDKVEKILLPHRSDLIRTFLLYKYGGVWADPTTYPLQPLDEWLPDKMGAGLFLFHKPSPDRIISNWFIAAEKDNYLLKCLYDELIRYWDTHDFRNLGSNKKGRLEYLSLRLINGRNYNLSQIWLTPLFTHLFKLYPYMVYHFMFYKMIKQDIKCADIYNNMFKYAAEGPHKLQHYGLLNAPNNEIKDLIDLKKEPLFKLKWKIDADSLNKDTALSYLFKLSEIEAHHEQ